MYMLHLFEADAAEPIEERLLPEGRLRIGRDRGADWPIEDPDHAISRAHLELLASEDGLKLFSVGANGVFDSATGARFPDRVAVPVELPCSFKLGRFTIAAAHVDRRVAPVPRRAGESLLEAFCEGAGLDASRLSDEEPAAIMRRAGAVYREMVGGLSELVQARDKARERHQFTRTTIAGVGNNPFKWGPTQRLAVDLLLDRGGGFLSGPIALRASFADVRRHMAASAAGHDAVTRSIVARFAPQAIEEAVANQSSLMRSRAALQMTEVAERYAALAREVAGDPGGTLDQVYVGAYDAADR
ncbi:MAG TPA: type VI secretion system-associated FHA domain protein [Sphingomonas sp.]|jgi:predicted component of type VI protein secretion system